MLFHLSPAAPAAGYGEAIVPIALVKQFLRVDGDDEDALIAALRDAAIDMVEQYANLRLGPTTGMVATFEGFGPGMRLGVGPVGSIEISAIGFIDAGGSGDSISAGAWRIDASGELLAAIGATWPAGASAVTVTFDAGYPAGQCPAALAMAVQRAIAFFYTYRDDFAAGAGLEADVPPGVRALCDRYRMPVL